MSHFSVVVHIPANNENLLKTDDYLEEVMLPWHEYESTGFDNQYVQQIEVTKYAVDLFTKLDETWYCPTSPITMYRSKAMFRREELEKRTLTLAEQVRAQSGELPFGERNVSVERDRATGEAYMLYIPDTYIRALSAPCHTEAFESFLVHYFGIANATINDMADAPATGPYLYIVPGTDTGPFPLDSDINQIRDTLLKQTRVFEYTNPNAKWDWWETGGRFDLLRKDGVACPRCKVEELSLTRPRENTAEQIWKCVVEDKKLDNEKEQVEIAILTHGFTKADLLQYPSKKAFIEDYCRWRPYAFIKDGIWHEPGQMGWFGCSGATSESRKKYKQEFDEMIKNCNPKDWLICIDCHI